MSRTKKLTEKEAAEIGRLLERAGDDGVDLRKLFRSIRRRPKSPLYGRLNLDAESCIEATNVRILQGVFEAYRVEVELVSRGKGATECRSVPGAVSVGSGYRATTRVIENVDLSAEQIESEWKRRDAIDARILDLVSVLPEWKAVGELVGRQREELREVVDSLIPAKSKVA